MENKNDGIVIVITGPSGTGKNTISQNLIDHDNRIQYMISATTRQPRSYETVGVDYHFLSKIDFQEKLAAGDFLEWNEYHDNFYGTLKTEITDRIDAGLDPLADVTYSGAKALKEFMPDRVVTFLLMPPSFEALEERMINRKKLSAESVAAQKIRLELIRDDMTHYKEEGYAFANKDMQGSSLNDYDYVIINDSLEKALEQFRAAILLERAKRR